MTECLDAFEAPASNLTDAWNSEEAPPRSNRAVRRSTVADLPANIQFLSPRLNMNNGATAAAVGFDCSGLYLEVGY